MTMAEKAPILILGATGYIGGSALSELLSVENTPYKLSALVRNPGQIEKLEDVGVKCILFGGLKDLDSIRAATAQHDIVIAAASARDAGCAKACIEGLSERREVTGHVVHYIHTSGASMLGDWPESGERIDTSFHSDLHEDIYDLEKSFPEDYSPVRKVNQIVVQTGEQLGVRTYIVPPPLICNHLTDRGLVGRGTGLFTEGSGQVHMLIQLALKRSQAVVVGSGLGIWSRVHIVDLSKLFSSIIGKIIRNKELPSGKTGYYFAENGSQSWESIARAIGKAGRQSGGFTIDDIFRIKLEEVASEFYNGDLRDAEGVLASNARIKADRAHQVLGWRPKFGEEAFVQEIKNVFAIMSNT